MAQSSSFDITTGADLQEVDNAVQGIKREIAQRFDFKDTGTSITQDDTLIELRSSTEDRLRAAVEVLKEKAVKREISLKALHFGPVQPAAKGTVRQNVDVNVGISEEKARELVKFIKGLKTKTQTQVQGDQVRVSAKVKDELQAVIRAVREEDFGLALQFVNFRP